MTNEANGHNHNDSPKPQQSPEDAHAQSFIGPVMICAVNGCTKSLPLYPVDRLAQMMAACFGTCMGEMLSVGHLGPLMQLRQRVLDVFEREMKKVKMNPPPQGQGQPATALPPDTAELLKKLKVQ